MPIKIFNIIEKKKFLNELLYADQTHQKFPPKFLKFPHFSQISSQTAAAAAGFLDVGAYQEVYAPTRATNKCKACIKFGSKPLARVWQLGIY